MSTTPDLPGPRGTELGDDDAAFDELAARAGAALRRPAPEDGVRLIAARRRRQQAGKAIVVCGIAVASLAGAWVIVSDRRDELQSPVDSVPHTLPATTVDSLPDTIPPTTVEVVPDSLPATTVEDVAETLPTIMWPQSNIDEVRQAQQLADAGDPAYTWQVDPRLTSLGTDRLLIDPESELWEYLKSPGTEIVGRFLREELRWEEFLFFEVAGVPDGLRNLVYLRCAPGATNPLYPTAWNGDQEAPGGHRCAPTIDGLRYEAVRLDLSRPDRQDVDGILVVSRWTTTQFAQADPSVVEARATARLEQWLQARLDGVGAEGYVEVFYLFGGPDEFPLLYATTTGASYERYEIERVGEATWPYGQMNFTVRLYAEGGATVVEQQIFLTEPPGLSFQLGDGDTTENGQRVPVPESSDSVEEGT